MSGGAPMPVPPVSALVPAVGRSVVGGMPSLVLLPLGIALSPEVEALGAGAIMVPGVLEVEGRFGCAVVMLVEVSPEQPAPSANPSTATSAAAPRSCFPRLNASGFDCRI